MPRLVLVRHARTAWNAENRFQGQSDIPLDEIGCQQAEALAERLRGARFDSALSSDLSRTRDTAAAVVAHHEVSLREDPRLREINLGTWEGLTHAEIRERDPEGISSWVRDRVDHAPPGGETLREMAERLGQVLADFSREPADSTLLVVSHGGALRMLLCLAIGMPFECYSRLGLGNASVSEVRLSNGRTVLEYLNDQSHLPAELR